MRFNGFTSLPGEPDEHARVVVGVSGSALASRSVDSATADAIATQGRSAVDRVLDWRIPPSEIRFFSHGGPVYEGGSKEDRGLTGEGELEASLCERGHSVQLFADDGGWRFRITSDLGGTLAESDTFFPTREDAAAAARETYEVDQIRGWFQERGYELILHQPGSKENGWFAPFMRHGSQGGSGPYGWGRTKLEAAEDARQQYLARERSRAEA